jgi:hypothetical protein
MSPSSIVSVVREGGRHVGHHDVEVVKPRDLGAAPQVVALLQAVGVNGVREVLDGEAERVLGEDRLPHPRRGTRGDPQSAPAQRRVEGLGQVQVRRGAHPVGEAGGGGHRPLAQDQVVVRELVVPAQVQRVPGVVGHHEAEHVDPEPPRLREVGHHQLGVGGPDDVGRLHFHAPNRGTWVSPSGTCTIRDSV